MFGQSFVFANPQIHTWTNVDMLRKDGRYVCGIRHWARDHTWKPNVFRMFLSRLCEVGSANAHAKFRQEFSRTEYPGDDKLRVPKDDFSTEYDFERKDAEGKFHLIQTAEDFALAHDQVRNVHTVYVVGDCLSGMAKWKVITSLCYWTAPTTAGRNFEEIPGSVSLEPVD